jgi:6-pyruvoyl-tetrahydropterin synthase
MSKLLFGFLPLCCGGVLLASEADELRERANAIRKEASVLSERGDADQAEQLKKEAKKLLEAAARLEVKEKRRSEPKAEKIAGHPKQRLQDLLAQERKLKESNASATELAEVREQIAGTERELEALRARRMGTGALPPEYQPQVEKLHAAARRIHHLRIAAENLKLAEAHDLARQILEKAEVMERDVHEAKEQLAAELHKRRGAEQVPDVIRDLRAEVERLRTQVEKLRQKDENR